MRRWFEIFQSRVHPPLRGLWKSASSSWQLSSIICRLQKKKLSNIFEALLLKRKLHTYFQENTLPNTNALKICPCVVTTNTRTLINTTEAFRKLEKRLMGSICQSTGTSSLNAKQFCRKRIPQNALQYRNQQRPGREDDTKWASDSALQFNNFVLVTAFKRHPHLWLFASWIALPVAAPLEDNWISSPLGTGWHSSWSLLQDLYT